MNRAVDHVLNHLNEPLSLERVAEQAGFSPFHFHRIFQSMLGETLNHFVRRLRLERALRILSYAPDRPLTDIALECGFGSSSDFSRSFKKHYGVPPSQFDVEQWRASRREGWQAAVSEGEPGIHFAPFEPGSNPDGFEAEMRSLPARNVAYIRVLDPYNSQGVPAAAERLVAWAERNGFADGTWLGYMWDDPEIVAHELCRYDVGVVLPDTETSLTPEGEVGRIRFPAMRVSEVEIRGSIDLEVRAIDWMFKTWLPQSGFVPSDQPAFEVWNGKPFEHGFEHLELWMHLPVEPAAPFGA